MRMIGITGGVGSGKSQVLSWLREHCQGEFLEADRVAHRLMARGGNCYAAIVELFGREILGEEGEIDRKKMGSRVFQDRELLKKLNAIVHPAVKAYIREAADRARTRGDKFLFLEAALLIEEKYDEICDEIWYIYCEKEVRMERLRRDRGYSDERIRQVMENQLPDEEYEAHCDFQLYNDEDVAHTYLQIERRMRTYYESV